jgi:hypothetical protein
MWGEAWGEAAPLDGVRSPVFCPAAGIFDPFLVGDADGDDRVLTAAIFDAPGPAGIFDVGFSVWQGTFLLANEM